MEDVRANADAILAHFSDTRLPFEPSRTYSHANDREDGSQYLGVNHKGQHNGYRKNSLQE
jgi:hypothetical protein